MATKSNGRQLILSGPQHVVLVVVVVVMARPDGALDLWSMTMLRLFLLLLLVPTSGTGSRSLLTQPPPEKIQDNSFVELGGWQGWPTATTSVPIESLLKIIKKKRKQSWNVGNKSTTGRDHYFVFLSMYSIDCWKPWRTSPHHFLWTLPLAKKPSTSAFTSVLCTAHVMRLTSTHTNTHSHPVHHSTSSTITLRFHAESISQYSHIRRLVTLCKLWTDFSPKHPCQTTLLCYNVNTKDRCWIPKCQREGHFTKNQLNSCNVGSPVEKVLAY